jgi:acyl-coenzyme A synthetase/AMP-(fatty) acid ligase
MVFLGPTGGDRERGAGARSQAKYGVPVLVSYAATEFGGGVAGWNVADHQRFWASKRGSVGRAHPGCELRAVDPATGEPVAAGADGLLDGASGALARYELPAVIRFTDALPRTPSGKVDLPAVRALFDGSGG